MKFINILLFAVLTYGLISCDSLVEDIADPVDTVEDSQLSEPGQIDFQINGVRARFNNVVDNATVQTSLLSDQFVFGGQIGGGATFPTFRDLNDGAPAEDNNSIDGTMNHLGEYRMIADRLLDRLDEIEFEEAHTPLVEEASFVGNFHGGLARYFWATYFGRDFQEGGGVISELENPADPTRGEFIPSDQMYELALGKLSDAEEFATDYELRLINTIKARIYLFQNNLEEARNHAENGLVEGDAPYQATYMDRTTSQANSWHTQGGRGRTQTVAAPRFYLDTNYLNSEMDENPEFARIPLFSALSGPSEEDIEEAEQNGIPYAQSLYLSRDASIDFATWQENQLILAEIDYRQDGDEDSALDRVNSVRDSHGIPELDEISLDDIFVERDKELFTMGQRLPDQRRVEFYDIAVDTDQHGWHLEEDTWWYLRITLNETDDNPNIDQP